MATSKELIAWYPLDGNGNDYSTYHNPSIAGLTYNTVYAKTGKSYAKCASGGSSNFAISAAKNLKEYTVSFWVYTSKSIDGDWKPMVYIDDNGSRIRFEACKGTRCRYAITQNSANKNWTGAPGYLYSDTSGDLSVYEKWHHIALAVGKTQVRAYIDGENNQYATSLANPIPGTFHILANHYSSVSDFKVWNYCLSKREVMNEYLHPAVQYTFEGYNSSAEGNPNLYASDISAVKGRGSGISALTATDKGTYTNYKRTDATAPASNSWPNISFPIYSFKAGKSYTITLKMRINKFTSTGNKMAITLRHSRVANDYMSGSVNTIIDTTADGIWKTYTLTRVMDAKFTIGSTEHTTSPRIELYFNNIKGIAGDYDFDITDVGVFEGTTPGNTITSPSQTLSYIPDSSGHYYNMNQSSTQPTRVYSPELGLYGLKMNGSSNYLYMPSIFNSMSSESWSYVVRFNTANSGATQTLLCDRASIGACFSFFIIGYNFRVDFSSMHDVDVGGIASNIPHEAVITYNGTTVAFYYDGRKITSWAASFNAHGTTTSIGASQTNGSGYGNYFNGIIYNAEIYPICLDEARVKNIYETRIKISDGYNLEIYNLNEGGTNKNITMDYHMNGNYSSIIEENGCAATKFYDDGHVKTDTLTASGAYLMDTSINGKFQAQSLNLNNCCNKSIYSIDSSIIGYSYDNAIYKEPDGSMWVRIFHHNNPTGGLFASADNFASGKVYKDENRWFAMGACSLKSSWEMMIKQKITSSSSEVKYRWTQPANPFTCSYADIHGKVTHNSSSGYSTYEYGGLFKKNSSTYIATDNNTNGSNWFGAIGSWSSFGGGIPAYPSGAVTSGYIDVYIRINIITGNDSSVMTSADVTKYIDGYIAGNL